MFLAAQAALLTRRVTPASHRGVIAAFGEHFVKSGSFSKDEGRGLSQAHEQRIAAEYDATTRVPPEEAHELLETARHFLSHVEAFLREGGS